MAPKASQKTGGLTLDKLARYDDVLTDALVDKVYYWTTIRKNKSNRFAASRGLLEEDIANILRKEIVLDKDPAAAVVKLQKLPGLSRFVGELRDPKEKEHFTRHMLRYVKIYMPDCPFEVTTTNRYTINDHEASLTARRAIKPHEEIKYLTGVRVDMTEEEEKKIELARRDFSMVVSSRKKTRSLFLGPARFANHDCDANATLVTKGNDGMQVVAKKAIQPGDEITVSYGEDYFGDDNVECLCQTCEDRLTNGWAPWKPVNEDEDENEEEEEKTETQMKKEKKKSAQEKRSTSTSSSSSSSSKKRKSPMKNVDDADDSESTSKKAKLSPPMESAPIELHSEPTPNIASPSSQKRKLAEGPESEDDQTPIAKKVKIEQFEEELVQVEDPASTLAPSQRVSREMRNQQKDGKLTITIAENPSSCDATPESSSTADSPKTYLSTDATSIEDEALATDVATGETVVTIKTEITTTFTCSVPIPTVEDEDASSELSELSSSCELDDILKEVVKRKLSKTPPATRRSTRGRSRISEWSGAFTLKPLVDGVKYEENQRKPGDYGMSTALTAIRDSKWKVCHTCDNWFVQQNGYQSRRECPRCERHSKVYGFSWPKTDKEGKHDKEQRILDHRKVHRFVNADEEKLVKKGKRAMKEALQRRFSTPRSQRDSSMSTEADSGSNRRRLRKTM